MATRNGNSSLHPRSNSLVDGLALSVILKVNASPHQHRNRRIEIGTKILLAAVLEPRVFDQEQLKSDLGALRIGLVDIVDLCIPLAAAELGEAWTEDRLSFAAVTAASSRLFGLCKSLGQEWDNIRPPMNARSLLLVTLNREDHILGPAVLSDQLRRRGHSVQLLSNSDPDMIECRLRQENFDGILISVSTIQALEAASGTIDRIRALGTDALIALGGAAIGHTNARLECTGADLVTNDIDRALDAMTGDDVKLRVAE